MTTADTSDLGRRAPLTSTRIDTFRYRLKHQIWMGLGRHSMALPLFGFYGRLSGKSLHVVNKHTEIVIEGYPRCANTMAVAAFLVAQDRPVTIARHLHAPAQILRGLKMGLPVLALARKPEDAVASLLVRAPRLSIRHALLNYVKFYSSLLPVKHRIVVGDFEEVTSDFGTVVDKVNDRYASDFRTFVATRENLVRCYALVEEMDRADRHSSDVDETTVARPSDARTRLKDVVLEELARAEFQPLLKESVRVYEKISR